MSDEHGGKPQDLCAWPLHPLWKNNGATLDCVFDQKSYDIWVYDFDAFEVPLYRLYCEPMFHSHCLIFVYFFFSFFFSNKSINKTSNGIFSYMQVGFI